MKGRILSDADVLVQRSTIPGIGKGLFVRRQVLAGDTIGWYQGSVITEEQSGEEPYVSSHYLFWVCKDHLIVGDDGGNYTRYINHSDRPNARFVVSMRWKTVRIEVIKRIRAGAEVFIDYGPCFWENIGERKR